ncbi:MAG: flavin reductase family protein [Cytophagales bacterium]|nr:MAG: flavin reductase family protein [Cytophagales bacterium]
MKSIRPKDISTAQFHAYMLAAIAPRPIAFASTIDKDGNINLSPFSFFNAFGSNPPILIFSPARRVRDNTEKHTLENVREIPEVTINVVNYEIVEQMSLASTEYEKGVNEFIKSGLTPTPSTLIRPPFVAESPVAFECKVNQVIETGKEGGAGNLIICEIVMAHIKEEILDEQGRIDTKKIDLVGRMGGDWYVRANHDALFEIEGIGVDNIPEKIRLSHILSGNNLGKLGNIEVLPTIASSRHFALENNLHQINLKGCLESTFV